MPKTPSKKLFNLVKSLSGSEKRYFKLFINQGEQKKSKYVQLFDAIEAQQEFDEDALKATIYQGETIESRKYSELKAYLYDLIIDSLQAYDEKQNPGAQLNNMLQGMQVLYKRSLFKDCHELLNKIHRLAKRYEKFEVLLEVCDWNRKIAYAQADIDYLDSNLTQIQEEEELYLKKLENLRSFQASFFSIYTLIRKKAVRNQSYWNQLNQILDTPLLKNESAALSHKALVLYFRIYSIYYYGTRNTSSFYETSKKLIELMESKAHLLQEDYSSYIAALSNLSIACGKLGKYDEVEVCLNKMKSIRPNTIDDQLKIHRQYYANYFGLCLVKGAFSAGVEALEKHQKEIKSLDKTQFNRSSFFFQYFCIYFGAGDYDQALYYLNQWLNQPKTIERQDLQSLARILNLVIHFEMGNYLLLDSLLRSAYRFFTKKNQMQEFERAMVQLFKQLLKSESKKGRIAIFESFKVDFERISKTSPSTSQMFDFESWLESKIQNKPLSKIIQSKFQATQLTV